LVAEVFQAVDRKWRGIGEIPRSGLGLRPEYADFDAELRFGVADLDRSEPTECRAGDVLRGRLKPTQCPAFGTRCNPERPLGAPMVSSEGACAAYYNYARLRKAPPSEVPA
jgi:hydrogenase expression/formation protein HypD